MNNNRPLKGQCHCGSITFEFETETKIEDMTPRACTCGFCSRHRAEYISDPDGTLYLHYDKQAKVIRYRFGTKTADFIICGNCACLVAATTEIGGRFRGILNCNSLHEQIEATAVKTFFHGETVSEREERRKKTWIGTVIENYHKRHPVIVDACG